MGAEMTFGADRKLWVGLRSLVWQNLHTETRFAAISTHAIFGDYRDFAVEMSRAATYALVWTLDGSPLKVQSEKADEEFKKYKCSLAKIRLVIFRSAKEIDNYIRAQDIAAGQAMDNWKERIALWRRKTDAQNAEKCKAFEDACRGGDNGGRIYFTSLHLLRTQTKLETYDLDIGVIWPSSESSKFCFQTDFLTKEFSDEGKVFGRVKVFPLKRNCEGVEEDIGHYERMILDLLIPNRFETRVKWAFDSPRELSKRTRRTVWLFDRMKRRSKRWFDNLIGFDGWRLLKKAKRAAYFIFVGVVLLFLLLLAVRATPIYAYIKNAIGL